MTMDITSDMYQSLVHNAADVITIVNPDFDIEYINHSPISEIPPDAVVGSSVLDYVSEEHKKLTLEKIQHTLASGEPTTFETKIFLEGRAFWYLNRVGPIYSGDQIVAAAYVSTDITQQRLDQEKLDIYSRMVANSGYGVYVWRLQDAADPHSFHLVASNGAAEHITGVPNSEIMGKPILEAFPNYHQSRLPELFSDLLETQQSDDLGEVAYSDHRVGEGKFRIWGIPTSKDTLAVIFHGVETKIELAEWEQYSLKFFMEA